jgi:hypothetical protein
MADTDRAITGSRIADFGGLRTNADPHDLKPGESVVQRNCGGSVRGVLRTRYGLKAGTFSDGNDSSGDAVWSCMPINSPLSSRVIYQTEDGKIKFATNPS